jgi:hypothetical protein
MHKIRGLIFTAFIYVLIFGFYALIISALLIGLYHLPNKIKNSGTYLKNFETEKYNQLQKNELLKKEKILELRKKECAILVQAKKDIVPLKIERYVLKGYKRDIATEMASYDIDESVIKCAKKGIAPYDEVIDK